MLVHFVPERPGEKDKKAWCGVKFWSSLAWIWVIFHTFQFKDDHLQNFSILSISFHCNCSGCKVCGDVAKDASAGKKLGNGNSSAAQPHSSIRNHPSLKLCRRNVKYWDYLRLRNFIELNTIRDSRSWQCHQLPQLWHCTQPCVALVCTMGWWVYNGFQFTAKLWAICSDPCWSILMLFTFLWDGHVHAQWYLSSLLEVSNI